MLSSEVKKLLPLRSLNNTTSLVTLYIPGKEQVAAMNTFVTKELSNTSNIKARVTRQGASDAWKSVASQLKHYKQFPKNGVVILAGTTNERKVSLAIEPPRPINRFWYKCERSFCI